MRKRILMIEDDAVRAKWVEKLLKQSGVDVDVTAVTNEKEFVRRFREFENSPPDLVIIDQMIPYTTDEDFTANAEALHLNAFEGGTRCYQRLSESDRTKSIPAIFYTILDGDKIPPNAEYVRKTGDLEQPELIEMIRRKLA